MSPTQTPPTLEDALRALSVPGADELVQPIAGKEGWVRCLSCGHACRIPSGHSGICKVRMNEEGTLLVPHGYVGALAVDPVEKKPFFHVHPGASAVSFGMLGCDLHCGYCQNWLTSQTLRDPAATSGPRPVSAEEIIDLAGQTRSRVVVSTYNEPLITSEWAVTIFGRAREEGLVTGFVSNGNATPEVLDYIRPVTDLYKVDLKSFSDKSYRSLGTVLARVLDTLAELKQRGFWVEVVTLLVPGFNDSDIEIGKLSRFLAGLDPFIPWHVTAFRSDYKMADTPDTPASTLIRAAEIGTAAGLRYVYCGNRTGEVGEWENTRCHACETTVIRRIGFRVIENTLAPGGRCPACETAIPGVWD